jgi:adenosylcobinamide-GDP ribazoletransferase
VHRSFSEVEIAQAPPLFPLIGALVGLVQIAAIQALAPVFPPFLLSVCAAAAAAAVTGGLHLDGLADTADGFGGGRSCEETLRIMRDPAIGTFGAVAVTLLLLTRTGAVSTLLERRAAVPFLVLAPALGRWTIVAIGHALPYARPEGGLGSLAAGVTAGRLVVATTLAIGISVAFGGRAAAVAWAAAAASFVLCRAAMARRLGGFTGDTLGATSEITEAAILMAAVVATR